MQSEQLEPITTDIPFNSNIDYTLDHTTSSYTVINRHDYMDRLHGFWLGQSIGNWTGLVTEMDKIGGPGPHGDFYTREDWGKPDQPAIWGEGKASDLSPSDDDTDLEYMYQFALFKNQTSLLTAEQIKTAWIDHIYDEKKVTPYGKDNEVYQNYLWVSNQRAHELMLEGMLPPHTSSPENNLHGDMIDAQLTTEIFGFFAPGHPDVALKMAALPIRTTASGDAVYAAEFYVILYSLAATVNTSVSVKDNLHSMLKEARRHLPEISYTAAMYDFVKGEYDKGTKWEDVRDELYMKYQVRQEDGYNISSRNLYCNGCFASGINFGASLISLFYGNGDIKETIKIATLCGWDSDNPAATWGGLIGFMLGKDGVEDAFGRTFSKQFNIHRTRKGFPNKGIDDFDNMARMGVIVADRAIKELLGGRLSEDKSEWIIP